MNKVYQIRFSKKQWGGIFPEIPDDNQCFETLEDAVTCLQKIYDTLSNRFGKEEGFSPTFEYDEDNNLKSFLIEKKPLPATEYAFCGKVFKIDVIPSTSNKNFSANGTKKCYHIEHQTYRADGSFANWVHVNFEKKSEAEKNYKMWVTEFMRLHDVVERTEKSPYITTNNVDGSPIEVLKEEKIVFANGLYMVFYLIYGYFWD